MTNNHAILCKPKNKELLAELPLLADDTDSERLNTLLELLPNEEMIIEYKKLNPDAVVTPNMVTIKRRDVHVNLQFKPRHVTFEQVGIQGCYQPYNDLETIAGKFNCVIYSQQAKFVTERPPGSLVRAKRETFLKDISQVPLADGLKMRLYLGYSIEDVDQIKQRTGILFEQQLDNLDYAEMACIEMLGVPIFLRQYLRAPQILVEFWSTIDPLPSDLFQMLAKNFSLVNQSQPT